MASFIELPRLGFDGRDQVSLYVNTDDIIAMQATYDGQTKIEIRALGNAGYAVNMTTYVPLHALLDILGGMARHPGVNSWADTSKDAWAAPVKDNLRKAAEAERAARA